jgi:hypothetical protein
MKKPIIFYLLIILAVSLSMSGCSKNENINTVSGEVALFLLKSFERIGNSCQINESVVVAKAEPIIQYEDILSYNAKIHQFLVSDQAKSAIEDMELSVTGLAFGV